MTYILDPAESSKKKVKLDGFSPLHFQINKHVSRWSKIGDHRRSTL